MPPGEAFTPTQPKTGRRRATGRRQELARILQLLRQDHAHVVLYSERGRGKTSLANLVVEALRAEGVFVARHICEAASTFDSIMHGLMRDLPPSLLAAGRGEPGQGCLSVLPPGTVTARDVVTLPDRLTCRSLVCVIDEFDRVEDKSTRTRLADTIKQLSDRDAPLHLLVVGVSDDLERILGQHPSIQRSVAGVHLPLFSDAQIAQIIATGARASGFSFPPASVARIAVLSRGMPHMAQLLGLRLTQAAATRGDRTVSEADFQQAVARMVEDAPLRVQSLYASMTDGGRDAEMVAALRLLATAPQDAWGRLRVGGSGALVVVAGRAVRADVWQRIVVAGIVHEGSPDAELHSFAERGLMHHVLLLAAGGQLVAGSSAIPMPNAQPGEEAPARIYGTEPLLHALAGR